MSRFDAAVQATPADCWMNPSPCDGWTAVDVVEHVASAGGGMTAALGGPVPSSFDRIAVTDSWNRVRMALLNTVESADLSTAIPGPVGMMPAEVIIERLMSVDILVHAWDLATAVGIDASLDPAAVRRAYDVMEPMDSIIRAPGVFGPKVAPAEGDDLQTEFLKFLGRAA